jgi:WhiB family redox-sensing transcriptional regulator
VCVVCSLYPYERSICRSRFERQAAGSGPGPGRHDPAAYGDIAAVRGLMEASGAELPSADLGRPRWMDRGACRGEPIETFFAGRGGEAYERARRLCDRCPVRPQCAEYAVVDPLILGWWGGMSERERQRIRASRAA